MTKEKLLGLIEANFKTKRMFINEFSRQGGELDETVLSSQLSGKRGLSSAWRSAYSLFFYHLKRES